MSCRLLAAPYAAMMALSTSAFAANASVSPPEQWYTGSLFSPSGAESKAGMLAIEPYLEEIDPIGKYDSNGHAQPIESQQSISNFILLKYGLTDHLTIYLEPSFSWGWGKNGATSGIKVSDLPVELQYRVLDADKLRFVPAITAFLGFSAPAGEYDELARTQDGLGTGAWLLRFGLLAQSEYRLAAGHALRVRLWAVGRQPFASVPVQGESVYTTPSGFAGRAHVGISGNAGTSLEFGLNQRWVLALDVYRLWANGITVEGRIADGAVPYVSTSGASGSWDLGPAVEYNWSAKQGAILGVIVPTDGHNTTRSVTPEVAVNLLF